MKEHGLSIATVRDIVLGEEDKPRAEFHRRHKRVVEDCIRRLHRVQEAFAKGHPEWGASDRRRMAVALMLHAAIHNVATALHLLVSGYPVPAGNAMRQYLEALSMALLFATDKVGDFAHYDADRSKYQANKSVDRLMSPKIAKAVSANLGLKSSDWSSLRDTRDFFHNHSHNTPTAVAFLLDFRKNRGAIIGAHYDPKKHRMYATELSGRVTALKTLERLVELLNNKWGSGASAV